MSICFCAWLFLTARRYACLIFEDEGMYMHKTYDTLISNFIIVIFTKDVFLLLFL